MIYYIYDGSFEGLLTAIYDAFYSDHHPDQIVPDNRTQQGLFSQTTRITTDEEKAGKVYRAIDEKISNYTLKSVYYAYLSEIEQIEMVIYRYLRMGFKYGDKVNKRLSNDIVRKMDRVRRKVSFESHRLKGLLRFRSLKNGIFYAPVEPDYNVISLMAPHFAARLADQEWIIHDLKREQAIFYNLEEWVLTDFDQEQVDYASEEEDYQELWKEFFKSIAIKNKKNPKLQRQYMPERYWKHLIEKDG